jgi:hypothetical protein
MNRDTFFRPLRAAALAIAGAFLALPAAAQTIDPANEGYDPMRQISTQFVRPNILLVFDVSGSMSWDEVSSHGVGTDQTGSWLTATWARTSSDCYNSKCRSYTATLTVRQTHPSRMATVKNALGDSMNIITPWSPPGGTCSDSDRQWPSLSWTGGTITGPTQTLNNTSNTYWEYKFAWTIAYGSRQSDPGNPFSTAGLTAQPPTIGCGCEYRPAANLIGKTKDKVNWGLEIFSGAASSCTAATLVIPPDSRDLGDVRGLQVCMRANSAGATTIDGVPYQGLFASGGTPSKAALAFAGTIMSRVAGGGSLTNYNNGISSSTFPTYYDTRTWSITADPKLDCGRVYATILVTDGLSNTCNPDGGGNWAEPCLTCTAASGGPGCPDGGYSGYTCPSPYPTTKTLQLSQVDAFLAEKADALWWMTVGGRRVKTRTWVIGVSDAVGPCELNYTAYRGRTDASAPEGDAGFDTAADPYLPEGNPGNYNAPTCPSHQPPHGNYAYFPKTSDALEAAFTAIIAAVGQGDYTTSAPSVTSSPLTSEGLVGFVASAAYPKWQGHLYAYDVLADCSDTSKWDCTRPCGWKDPDSGRRSNCLWDAGEILSIGALNPDGSRKAPNNGLARKLYTWDPANDSAMVPIEATDAGAQRLDALCGGCGITAQVADFMLGNNGSGAPRAWKLGAVMNSTQAVVGPAQVWKQGTTESHTDFENTYQERHPVVWAGASDGFIHAFDAIDGAELVALLPPEMLAKQAGLYENYLKKPNEFVTGQPKLPDNHVYGAANSPRFGDIWFEAENTYKTVLFMSQGPGGTGIAAIDVTHPFPGRDYDGDGGTTGEYERTDPNYGYGADPTGNPDPVRVIWSKNRGDYDRLGQTWSVPAIGASSADTWQLLVGAGFDTALATTTPPVVYRLDPVDGSRVATQTLSNQSSGAYVRNQSFADSVLWQRAASFFQPDNRVDEGIQVDLHGQLWTFQPNTWNASRLLNLGSNQPLYYPPAAAAYPASSSPTHQIYAFASGSFYEKSPNVTGRYSTFEPRLYLAVKNRQSGALTSQYTAIRTIPKPSGQSGTLGAKTQVTSPPLVFVAKPGSTSNPFALFLVYDPDAGVCVGNSYIIKVDFNPAALTSITIPPANVYLAGAGAASGLAVAGDRVVVSRSYVGEDGRAFLQEVPNLRIPQGGMSGNISWWMELQ